ncbi:hypothetical protein C0993_000736, partial [Termitomyces sp. T159_Od127]
MHFKSFVILATSLASLASALAVGDLVGTTVNTAVDTVGTVVDTTKPVIDSLIGSPQVDGTTLDSTTGTDPTEGSVGAPGSMPIVQVPRECTDLKRWNDYRREKDIAAIRKKYKDVNKQLIIRPKPVKYQTPLEYTGKRSNCTELQREKELLARLY